MFGYVWANSSYVLVVLSLCSFPCFMCSCDCACVFPVYMGMSYMFIDVAFSLCSTCCLIMFRVPVQWLFMFLSCCLLLRCHWICYCWCNCIVHLDVCFGHCLC